VNSLCDHAERSAAAAAVGDQPQLKALAGSGASLPTLRTVKFFGGGVDGQDERRRSAVALQQRKHIAPKVEPAAPAS